MNIHIQRITKVIAFLGLLCILVYGLTIALLPKIPDFYQEDEWDVVFFGTSASYCSFNPAVFDEYGLKSYNRGRQQQPINYTYYYIKDALETSDIDVVVLETLALTYWEGYEVFTEEGVRDSSLNDMRYSKTKVEAILDCVPREKQIGYLFPLDKYHSNWEKLDDQSFPTLWEALCSRYDKESSERGFFPWDSIQECFYLSKEALDSEVRRYIYDFNMKYLNLIKEECKEQGAKLVLVRTPLPCEDYIVEIMNTLEEWAKANDVEFINYMDMTEEIGMNWKQDSLDGGSHLNVYGAEKVSGHLAKHLKEQYFNQ